MKISTIATTLAAAGLMFGVTTQVQADFAAEVQADDPLVYYDFNDEVGAEVVLNVAAGGSSVGAAGNGR